MMAQIGCLTVVTVSYVNLFSVESLAGNHWWMAMTRVAALE